MRILLVNKYYYLRSGTERYLFNLQRLLEQRGHQAAIFAMRHPQNQPNAYESYFAPSIDYQSPRNAGFLQASLRVLWYPEAARRIARLLDEFRPDVVHLFNIYHHLSPAILQPITRRGIPIVHTLNDYKLICPNYLLFTQGEPCMRCRDQRYWHAVRFRCLHGSVSWSALAAIEMTLHKRLQVYERSVRTFIAPSQFVRQAAIDFGIAERQVSHLPYFLYPEDYQPASTPGEYLAYFGRLSAEKGLPVLLKAMSLLPHVPLRLAGEGPARPELQALVDRLKLSNVRLEGYLSGRALADFLANARATILPSIWPEVSGQSILESFATGLPVAAARIGGIPELVAEGENADGALFPPGDEHACAARLEELWKRHDLSSEMGRRGREKVRRHFGPEAHFPALLALYQGEGQDC